jgi:phosphatidylethanolamine-binding protein (PEBP) family uncharacterized protein
LRASTGAKSAVRQTISRPERVPTETEHVPAVTMLVTIPTLLSEQRIPKRYTCDGQDMSLPVRWSHVPPATAELAVFVLNLRPIRGRFFFDWAVSGLSPAAHGVPAGVLPREAVVGRNSFGKLGYSICPAKGVREDFVVRVLALPHTLATRSGFDAEAVFRDAERSAEFAGISGGIYTRP